MSNPNKRSYTVYINSNDKMSGTANNSAQYQINWDDLLDRKYNSYKLYWNLTTESDLYENTSTGFSASIATVNVDFGGKTYSFDTKNKSSSTCIGYIYRDAPTTSTTFNSFSCTHLQNSPKMLDRPTQNFITVSINLLTVDTNGNAHSDMGNYHMQLEFIPVEDSKI